MSRQYLNPSFFVYTGLSGQVIIMSSLPKYNHEQVKNKTNHPISSDSNPSAIAKSNTMPKKGVTKPTGASYNFEKSMVRCTRRPFRKMNNICYGSISLHLYHRLYSKRACTLVQKSYCASASTSKMLGLM